MAILNYQLWSKGPELRTDGSESVQYNVGVLALAKRSPSNRYEVANEWLGMRLGEALNLPIPPGVPVSFGGNEYFCSLNFAGAGGKLPPIDIPAFVSRHPSLACGIVVFDSWICNEDRHDENVSWIEADSAERDVIHIFDHGRALLAGDGVGRLVGYETSLPSPELAAHVVTLAMFDEWDNRLRHVSETYIASVVREANRLYLLDEPDLKAMTDFLLRRRRTLRSLFAADQDARRVFQSLRPGLWAIRDDSKDTDTSDDIEYKI